MRIFVTVIFLVSALLLTMFLWPDRAPERASQTVSTIDQLREDIEKKNATIANFQNEIKRLNQALTHDKQVLRRAILANNEYVVWKFSYLKWIDQNSKNLFRWQVVVLYLVSVLTLGVVGFAIVHAVRELGRSLPRDPTLRGRAMDLISVEKAISESGLDAEATQRIYAGLTDNEGKVTNLTFGSTGVTVASAASWVLVLVIAFAYLYVFVTEVMRAETITFALPSIDHPADPSSPPLAGSGGPNTADVIPPKNNASCSGAACDPPGE